MTNTSYITHWQENQPPEGFENFDIYVSVDYSEKEIIGHLLKTNWIKFGTTGTMYGSPSDCYEKEINEWFGLNKKDLR